MSRQFHPLRVAVVDRLTIDSVAVTFDVPAELRETYAFEPGQHLTLRLPGSGDAEVRRSYSICSTPAELAAHGRLRVGIRQIPDGVFSTFATGRLAAGDPVEVLPPLGHFVRVKAPDGPRHYAAVVAGSGITPVLSIMTTVLATEPQSRFTVFYGNRSAGTVMFAEELSDLKDRYPARLHLVHVLSRESQGAELLSGRLDADRLPRLFTALLPDGVAGVDEWFLCGPLGMVMAAKALLGDGAQAVHTELFHVEETAPQRPANPASAAEATVEATIVLDGRASTFAMRPDERILDAALRVRGELPYACKGGVCSTCRARICEGRVEMARNFALEPDELAAGYVLTCQASPVTGRVVVDFDA